MTQRRCIRALDRVDGFIETLQIPLQVGKMSTFLLLFLGAAVASFPDLQFLLFVCLGQSLTVFNNVTLLLLG